MYRLNDNELAVQFLEQQRAGDLPGMVQAATALWLHPVEQPGLADEAAEAVWNGFVEVGAAADAVRAILGLVRQHQRVRPAAFLQAVQNLRGMREEIDGRDAAFGQPVELSASDVELALELATLALDELGTEYLAPIFVKLVEGRAKSKLLPYLRSRLEQLRRRDDTWQLVAFLMATTSMGSSFDFEDWLGDWERRRSVPMWLVALLINELRPFSNRELPQVLDSSRRARATLERDGTERYLIRVEMEVALRADRWDEFRVLRKQHAAWFSEAISSVALLDHPVVRYANALKRDHPVGQADFDHRKPQLIRDARLFDDNRVNQGIVDVARAIAVHDPVADRTFRIFDQLLALERGSGRLAHRLAQELRSFRRPSELAWVPGVWNRAVRQHLGWFSLVRAMLFS